MTTGTLDSSSHERRPHDCTGEGDQLFRSLVGNSPGIAAVRKLIAQVAPSDATVLVMGETGTGKEVVARNIHYHSARRSGPFVAINCGAIPPELLESELFGHEKGAFTGALTARPGRFELACGGTLFLDEVGDMRLDMQVKLLRVLQEQRFDRLGGTTTLQADVRVIAATHRDLEQMIAEGKFREDLFYRLHVIPVHMPPLRERRSDIPLLVAELNARLERRGAAPVRFSAEAQGALFSYEWPGNVRELANLVERCSILQPNADVGLADLPIKIRGAVSEAAVGSRPVPPGLFELDLDDLEGDGIQLKGLLESLEVRLIRQALDKSGGVVAQAAKRLGLRRTTLIEKIRKFGIENERLAPSPEI